MGIRKFKLSEATIFLGLLLLVSPFVYSEIILDPVLIPRVLYFAALLMLFIIYRLIFKINKTGNLSVFSNPMVWVYLGFVLFSGVSVIVSVNTGEGIWEFLRVCLYFVLFLVAVLILKDEKKYKIILPEIFIPFSAIIIIYGVIQLVDVLKAGPLDHQTSYLINGVFAHRNLYAQMLFMAIAFLLMGAYFLRGLLRWVTLCLMCLSLVLITLLLVKSVWMALLASTVLSFILLLIFRKGFKISFPVFKRLLIYTFAAMMIVFISVAVYSRFNTIEIYKKQTYALKDYSFGSAAERVHLWEKSVEMFKDSPVIGLGLGNWRVFLPHYETSGLRSAEGEIIYQRPHNDFLWVLAERGMVTFGFYLLLFLISIFYQIRIIQKSPDKEERYFGLFLLFFMIGYMVFASLSFPMERPTHTMILNLVFALSLISYHKTQQQKEVYKSKYLSLLLTISFVILAGILYLGFGRFKSEMHTKNALDFRADKKWQQVIDEIDKAETYFTKLDPTATPLRWYSGLAWFNLGEMKNAETDFMKAYKANPYHLHVLNNLGTICGNRGDYKKAITYYKEAVRISPQFWDAALNLSASLFNMQQIDSAYAVLRNVPKENSNPNYKNIVQALVYQKIENLKKTVDDRELELILTRIRNSNEWMLKVHQQSINDNISLEKLMFAESIYMLQTVDSAVDKERADYLRQKYISE